MNQVIPLQSDERLPDTEHHFRVVAGPGAGKTYWLARHIVHVASHSKRLPPSSNIGVISYTNVAVRELVADLGTSANLVDASTIHSFLFRHIVRPYAHLLSSADRTPLIAHHLVDTHGEHFPVYTHLKAWLQTHGKQNVLYQDATLERLKNCLQSLTVRVTNNQPTYATTVSPVQNSLQVLLTHESILAYKTLFWKEGNIDHEDVLYLSFRLLHEFPLLRRFLSDRFPYVFIDEFQDTLPVQAAIVTWLAAEGTIVGVIGDPEQAIYGFIDASPTHFRNFQLPSFRSYEISGNRRSTDAIIGLLNKVRTDALQQTGLRNEAGTAPLVYAGDLGAAIVHAATQVPENVGILVLGRKHDDIVLARRAAEGNVNNDDPWEVLSGADTDRMRFLLNLATATDLFRRGIYDTAVQRLVQGISSRNGFRDPLQFTPAVDIVLRRSVAMSLLQYLVSNHAELNALSTYTVYERLVAQVPGFADGLRLKAVRAGAFRTAAEHVPYRDLLLALRVPDETRTMRTIHQAKGSEADAVFVILGRGHAAHILSPAPDIEEQRVLYVALSRARNHLFLYCPDARLLAQFQTLGLRTHTVSPGPQSQVAGS
ncbi:MAG: ATP-dependent helicase [Planctomycetaceae bacterium]|nr:ATP-dependent helicase [Planctomycetaceae bacterium]